MRKYFCDICKREMTLESIFKVEWRFKIERKDHGWCTFYIDLCSECIYIFEDRIRPGTISAEKKDEVK